MKKLLGFLLLFFIAHSPVYADYPSPSGYVNDFAKILSPAASSKIEKKLSDYDKKTTNQIAVVTIQTTEPETIEEYSIHLAEKWKIGQKETDNGILMLFAIKDRQMRIEVGRGLEGDVTDIEAKYILRDITPFFQKGDYEEGIEKGVDAVIASIETVYKPLSPPAESYEEEVVFFILFIIFIFSIAYSPYTPLGGQGVWGTPVLWGRFPRRGSDDGFGGFGGGTFSGGGASHKW